MKLLVTAGPTREPIDDVRFLANSSSGRMGFAVAEAALARGHRVVLVSGPTARPPPFGPTVVRVGSADEMRSAVLAAFPSCDGVVMTAAVADYRPAERIAGKRKKTAEDWALLLTRTPDILAELGAKKDRQILVGFALEVENSEENARRKLAEKRLDLIVLNSPSALGAEFSDFRLLCSDGRSVHYRSISKDILALRLVSFVTKDRLCRMGW